MVSVTTLIVTALVFMLIGAVLGALIYSANIRSSGKGLEQRLRETEDNLQRYQQDVAGHFAETAQLVNNLTESYREVHEHLANGALKLTTPAISRQILASADTHLLGREALRLREEQFQAPRDWAPKAAGTKGTLSEDYGLRDDDDDAEAAATEETKADAASDADQEALKDAPKKEASEDRT